MSFTDLHKPVPAGLRTEEFVLRPIEAADAERDHAAVMETREVLRVWEQSSWPEDTFTVEENRKDLIDLEQRHLEHRAFTYTVEDPEGVACLGCVYIFPPTATFLARSAVTAVGDADWGDVDAVIYFWVRRSRMMTAMDRRLLVALRAWMRDEWPFRQTVYVTNEQFEQQVRLLEGTDMSVRFELREPDKPGTYLVFG